MPVTAIPSLGFARGAVVRLRVGGPNMLVVRGLGDMTAVISIMGDGGGQVRLFEVETAALEQLLPQGAITDAAIAAIDAYFSKTWPGAKG